MGSVDTDNEKGEKNLYRFYFNCCINISKDLYLRCEFSLDGEKDNGYGDYVIFERNSNNLICIGEAKKTEMTKAVGNV